MVCKYSFIGEAPLPPGGGKGDFNPAAATNTDRICRTIPLVVAYVLDETIFPGNSKNSLRLAYFTHPQYVSLCFPQPPSTEKFKISCPATHCRLERDEDNLVVVMKLSECQFSYAGPEASAQYTEAPQLEKWVLASTVHKGGELMMRCVVMGNALNEKGSAARLAHQFAEHVVHASSVPPPPLPMTGRGVKSSAFSSGYRGRGSIGFIPIAGREEVCRWAVAPGNWRKALPAAASPLGRASPHGGGLWGDREGEDEPEDTEEDEALVPLVRGKW